MADITGSGTLHSDIERSTAVNPGGTPPSTGPSWARSAWDHLVLPSGRTIGETPTHELLTELNALGIKVHPEPGLAVGRDTAISLYAAKAGPAAT